MHMHETCNNTHKRAITRTVHTSCVYCSWTLLLLKQQMCCMVKQSLYPLMAEPPMHNMQLLLLKFLLLYNYCAFTMACSLANKSISAFKADCCKAKHRCASKTRPACHTMLCSACMR